MTPKEKAKELVFKKFGCCKRYALIAVENEYNSLREMLFNLKSCHVIKSERVYLFRLQKIIDEEQEVKKEIEKL